MSIDVVKYLNLQVYQSTICYRVLSILLDNALHINYHISINNGKKG